MKPVFTKKQEARFKKLGIVAIYSFGSRVLGTKTPSSDFDIGVVFKNPDKYTDNTMKIYMELHKLLSETFPKETIDIVFLQFTPLSLQLNAISDGKLLYEENKQDTYSYKEYVMNRHADIKHVYDLSNKYLFERI